MQAFRLQVFHKETFKSTCSEEHLRTAASKNVFMKLRKINIYSSGVLILQFWKRLFQHQYQKQVKVFAFISWFVSHEVCIHIQSFFGVVKNKLQTNTISRANQKKIKSSRKEYVMWTCVKFWPIKTFSKNYNPMKVWLWLVCKFS